MRTAIDAGPWRRIESGDADWVAPTVRTHERQLLDGIETAGCPVTVSLHVGGCGRLDHVHLKVKSARSAVRVRVTPAFAVAPASAGAWSHPRWFVVIVVHDRTWNTSGHRTAHIARSSLSTQARSRVQNDERQSVLHASGRASARIRLRLGGRLQEVVSLLDELGHVALENDLIDHPTDRTDR